MRLMLICLLTTACAHSTADIDEAADYVSRGARDAVDRALVSLREGDEKTFRGMLSEERNSGYAREFFELWADKIKQYDSWSMGQYEPGDDLIEGTVTVVFKIGYKGFIVSIRIRFEDGQWRWHHK